MICIWDKINVVREKEIDLLLFVLSCFVFCQHNACHMEDQMKADVWFTNKVMSDKSMGQNRK